MGFAAAAGMRSVLSLPAAAGEVLRSSELLPTAVSKIEQLTHGAPLSFLLLLACKPPSRGLGNWPAQQDDQACRYAPKRE
jgi:hypothetical protein